MKKFASNTLKNVIARIGIANSRAIHESQWIPLGFSDENPENDDFGIVIVMA
jgi:hypothetical protein